MDDFVPFQVTKMAKIDKKIYFLAIHVEFLSTNRNLFGLWIVFSEGSVHVIIFEKCVAKSKQLDMYTIIFDQFYIV